jgi:colanic acid/amylovoran biosynthesis protein
VKKLTKLLIVGNHTCGNRGDAAILRGLIEGIKTIDKGIQLTITSRYPNSSSYLLGVPLVADILHKRRRTAIKGLLINRIKKVRENLDIRILHARIKHKGLLRFFPLSKYISQHINSLQEYDAVIQVGGSFFVDSYGIFQFEHALCTLNANKPLLILGHSVGPFSKKSFKHLSNSVFNQAKFFGLRESVSEELVNKELNITNKVHVGTDTAWLVSPVDKKINIPLDDGPYIAVTLRELAPFDKKLKVSQDAYETEMALLCDHLMALGYKIIAVSTCTAIDGYHKDDRMIALNVQLKCKLRHNFTVLMDEYNDIDLGIIFSKCALTIGTRLHSAIISMNFGTPAFALNYEHKSQGIMNNLCLPELSIPFEELMSGAFTKKVELVLGDINGMRTIMQKSVEKEKQQALTFIDKALEMIKYPNNK